MAHCAASSEFSLGFSLLHPLPMVFWRVLLGHWHVCWGVPSLSGNSKTKFRNQSTKRSTKEERPVKMKRNKKLQRREQTISVDAMFGQ